MAGSEYYDDRKCSYCGTWYGVEEKHSCAKLNVAIEQNKAIQDLQNKINTGISYTKAQEMYYGGLRVENVIDVGFKLKSGWVSKYG